MALSPMFQVLENGLSMDFSTQILIVVNLGLLVFYAKDFKLGLSLSFLFNGLLFMWFFNQEWNWVLPLILFFMSLIFLSLTLYAVSRVTSARGFV